MKFAYSKKSIGIAAAIAALFTLGLNVALYSATARAADLHEPHHAAGTAAVMHVNPRIAAAVSERRARGLQANAHAAMGAAHVSESEAQRIAPSSICSKTLTLPAPAGRHDDDMTDAIAFVEALAGGRRDACAQGGPLIVRGQDAEHRLMLSHVALWERAGLGDDAVGTPIADLLIRWPSEYVYVKGDAQ